MDFSYWNLSFDSFAFQSENDLGSEKEMKTSPAKISLYLHSRSVQSWLSKSNVCTSDH